jgi:hypothetical protein
LCAYGNSGKVNAITKDLKIIQYANLSNTV